MKNRLSIKSCQKNLLIEKKYNELGKYSSISYMRESQDAYSLACACCGGKKTITSTTKKHNKMKKLKFIRWVDAGRNLLEEKDIQNKNCFDK